MKSTIYQNLPYFIKSILLVSEGWLVGGALRDLLEGKEPNDWDIIVPSRELFQIVNTTLASCEDLESKINTFGGIKYFNNENDSIDIWCEELDHFLKTANKKDYIFNLKRNILLKVEN